ncbi:dicarboxylate/amino acid:cation symporter [Borrelia anserina]|uniref:Sodium:dicarboxylate symporter family protein n=2 Tax=Borrelia anserina TaxID=143 RepID=W5STP1_BORAN|nr:cation:dicarboxylase symporter family transporter [Borrelia anserina]AHH08376.1 Sodium:dicarboxylate symporter family protein [Borrelia anserina BA2]APR64866.1 glutamate transporter [Borrelia anserina Es]UPA06784.1 dicarboxylate/amino acid:cation symporter [Borrelia anserina]
MNTKVKFFLTMPIGILLGLFLPSEAYNILSQIFIRLAYFSLIPFLIFSIPLGIENIIENKKFRRLFGKTIYYGILINIIGALISIAIATIYLPQRIPILDKNIRNLYTFDKTTFLETFFPKNIFTILTNSNPNLLSIYIISIIIGTSFYYAKQKGRIARELILSISNLFYNANGIVVKLLHFGIIFITASYTINLTKFKNYQYYIDSIIFLSLWTIIIILIIIPMISYRFTKNFKLSYKNILISIQNIIFAGLTMDTYAPYSILIEDIKNEKIKVKKSIITNIPIINFISKSGTIFISTISFFIILKSYSSLPISIYEIGYMSVLAFLCIFAFPHIPNSLIYIITMLCSTYTKGIELSHSNIIPILPILTSLALMIDFTSNIAIMQIIDLNELKDT